MYKTLAAAALVGSLALTSGCGIKTATERAVRDVVLEESVSGFSTQTERDIHLYNLLRNRQYGEAEQYLKDRLNVQLSKRDEFDQVMQRASALGVPQSSVQTARDSVSNTFESIEAALK